MSPKPCLLYLSGSIRPGMYGIICEKSEQIACCTGGSIMEFGWLNITGAAMILLLLIPNMIYAAHKPKEKQASIPPWINMAEQAGRFGCMALMVLPLGVGSFGFASVEAFLICAAACALLLAAYYLFWLVYSRTGSRSSALMLAVLPCLLFMLRGAFLRHWLLTAFGAVFAAAHIYITLANSSEI